MVCVWLLSTSGAYAANTGGDPDADIEIVVGEDRTIYEYRQNGQLRMVQVVPKRGRPYYMVPADGSPHYTDLGQQKHLYPRWVILEW